VMSERLRGVFGPVLFLLHKDSEFGSIWMIEDTVCDTSIFV
jgi:hypothetical protein